MDESTWRVIEPPEGLEAFAGPHTLYVARVGSVGSSGRARVCVLVVTCQMIFLCDRSAGAVRRAIRVGDLVSATPSTRPCDTHPIASKFLSECSFLLLRVKQEHDLLLCIPDGDSHSKPLDATLRAVYGEATGAVLPFQPPPRGGTLFAAARLRKPEGYSLPPPDAVGAALSGGCRCWSETSRRHSTTTTTRQVRPVRRSHSRQTMASAPYKSPDSSYLSPDPRSFNSPVPPPPPPTLRRAHRESITSVGAASGASPLVRSFSQASSGGQGHCTLRRRSSRCVTLTMPDAALDPAELTEGSSVGEGSVQGSIRRAPPESPQQPPTPPPSRKRAYLSPTRRG
eukprot:Hpha_TRINITY_DN30902_c0_g1::TRINITY_DN30902_c0_g1_i1::g.112381::m.112381